jgi:hypothetical protein
MPASAPRSAPVPPIPDEVAEFLDRYPPEIRELAVAVRAMVLSAEPGLNEKVYPGWRIVAFRLGDSMAGMVGYLGPVKGGKATPAGVNLGFNLGARLPDPAGLLEGTGKEMRHVKFRVPEDVPRRRAAVTTLVRAAVAETLAAEQDRAMAKAKAKPRKAKASATSAEPAAARPSKPRKRP